MQWELDTEVSPSHHQPIRFREDVLNRCERLRTLDLRNHGAVVASKSAPEEMVAQLDDVGPLAHERQREEVDPGTRGERGVVEVLLGQGGSRERCAGDVDPLVARQAPAADHGRADVVTVGGVDTEGEIAVVEQDLHARCDLVWEGWVVE